MALTGWTYETLRDQPAHVVRGLMHRVFASRAWDHDVAALARRPAGTVRSHGSPAAWATAQRAKAQAMASVAQIEPRLWPEDDSDD